MRQVERAFDSVAASAAKVREGMICERVLDGVVKNKYADNPGKLAAWISASHVKSPRRKRHPANAIRRQSVNGPRKAALDLDQKLSIEN